MTSPPRIFGIPASRAPIVAVVRRGPSDWCHVGRWDLAEDTYEPGAWFRGTLYPQKCDVSPDGRWFVYSAMKQPGDWLAGAVYEAVSRLPWLTALAAWGSGSTYTRGMHFVSVSSESDVGEPDVGDAKPCLQRFGLRWTRPEQFAVERRHGWSESADTPPRAEGGPWDENRPVEMVRKNPVRAGSLHVAGRYAAFRTGDPADDAPVYWLNDGGHEELLDDAQWADWDARGRLLVATADGMLQTRDPQQGLRVVADLGELRPNPQPAPAWASEW